MGSSELLGESIEENECVLKLRVCLCFVCCFLFKNIVYKRLRVVCGGYSGEVKGLLSFAEC